MEIEIRDAVEADLPAIAALQSASWKSAYRSILSPSFLEGVDELHRRDWASLPGEGFVLAAFGDGRLIGFAAVYPGEEAYGGLVLENLHVAPETRGSGIGRILLDRVLSRAADSGADNVYLWVFEDNVDARRFYVRQGGIEAETRQVDFGDTTLEERRVAWSL